MYKVQVTPLIGLPRFDGWAHVTTISSGTMVFALSVEGQHARNIGRDLLDLINQDTAISSGAELYRLATKLIQDTQDKEGKLSLACGFLVTEAKSTFCVFNASITLKRDGKSGQLLQSGNQLQIIEGNTQLEDSYVFATSQANQFLGEVKQKFDQGFDSDTIVTSITPSLHLEETTATSAMAFVDFRDASQVKVVKTLESAPETSSIPVREIKPDIVPDIKNIKVDADVEGSVEVAQEVRLEGQSESRAKDASEQDVSWLSPVVGKSTTLASNFLGKASALGTSFSQGIKKIASWRPPATGEVYVGSAGISGKKIRVWLGIGLVVLLIAAAGGLFMYQRSQRIADASSLLAPFLTQIQQVNDQVASKPIEARQNLQQIIAEMESLEASLEDESVAQKKIAASLEDARKLYDEISGKEVFSELPIFFNSRDQNQDILITNSEIVDAQFVFFDRQKKQGILVGNDGEVKNSFSAENIESDIKDVSIEFGVDTFWLLANQVFSMDPTQSNQPSEKLTDDERLDQATLVAAFANSLYVFNGEERSVFKYPQSDDGFDDPTRWVRSVPGLDFEQIVDIMIDGDVWLSSKKGEIFRLRSGNRQDFSFSGLEKPFASSVYMYSQEELQNLYFLEPAESRVVIADKDGVFVRQVTSSSLAAASHIIVSPDETRLLAVSGSTVYLIEL